MRARIEASPQRKRLGWRVQTDDDGGFDELVVHGGVRGQNALVHAEMMDHRSVFVSVGNVSLWAHVDKMGRVKVTMAEGATLDEQRTSPPKGGG